MTGGIGGTVGTHSGLTYIVVFSGGQSGLRLGGGRGGVGSSGDCGGNGSQDGTKMSAGTMHWVLRCC